MKEELFIGGGIVTAIAAIVGICNMSNEFIPAVQAAPVVTPGDLSEDTLKGIGTDRQKASIDAHNKAKAKAEKDRKKAADEAREITARNDEGMKKTIQKRHLNDMLPPCDREPEGPRDGDPYEIRY